MCLIAWTPPAGGEGSTAREVLRHRTVETVVMVDIDKAVTDACSQHLERNRAAWSDPRLTLVTDDARSQLEVWPHKFDVIIGDLADPLDGGPCYQLYTQVGDGLQISTAEEIVGDFFLSGNSPSHFCCPGVLQERCIGAAQPRGHFHHTVGPCWIQQLHRGLHLHPQDPRLGVPHCGALHAAHSILLRRMGVQHWPP